MAPRNSIIIDTDPGVDDVLSMLLAFSARKEDLEVLLLSVTFGNVEVESCLKNIMSLFQIIEKEIEWRKASGKPEGFEALRASKPLIAVGADEPLGEQLMMADYFHGRDGLGGIHTSHPHLSPEDTWKSLFSHSSSAARAAQEAQSLFRASSLPAHEQMLELLRAHDPDTITIVAIGPSTNLARAAATNPESFLRAKEIVVMGGAIGVPGNITPVAEFNIYADSIAASRLFALTSPNPSTTMPPAPPPPLSQDSSTTDPETHPFLNPYPDSLSRPLKLTLLPLDITTPHLLRRGEFRRIVTPLMDAKSPLAEWVSAFLTSTFAKVEALHLNAGVTASSTSGVSSSTHDPDAVGLEMHDPLCIWYVLTNTDSRWRIGESSLVDRSGGPCEDLRVETTGQWSRGMCIVDRRDRRRRTDDVLGEIPSDTGNWLGKNAGNRVRRVVASPGTETFEKFWLETVLGQVS